MPLMELSWNLKKVKNCYFKIWKVAFFYSMDRVIDFI